MRFQRIATNQSTGAITGDVHANFGSDWRIRDVRLDECMSDFADCIVSLDRSGSYTFHDKKRGRQSLLHRDGSEVVVQLHSPDWPDEAACRLDYSAFRAGVLAALRHYRDQLDANLPGHPAADHFERKLSQVEAELGSTDGSSRGAHGRFKSRSI
jgi:hypothetical protein